MSEKRIGAQWNSYFEEILLPAGCGPVQVEETRRAFYAGASTLFSVIMNVLEPGAEPTAADLHAITDLDNELKEYLRDLESRWKVKP